MAGLLAGPPAIRLSHSVDSPRGSGRGYAPPRCCDSTANERGGARHIQTPTKWLARLLSAAQIIFWPDVGSNEAEHGR